MTKQRFTFFSAVDFLALVSLVLFWLIFLIKSPAHLHEALVDDAYIFQRVVDNIWSGVGWTYNTDAHVNPITSPFYALVLLCAKILPLSAQDALSAVYFFALFMLGVGVYVGTRSYGRLLAWVVAVTVGSGAILVGSWGMETSVFMACVVWAVSSFERERYIWAGMLCAFAALSRPEGVALICILSAVHFLKRRNFIWSMLLVFFSVLAPWFLYSWFVHGYILPNSVSVKVIQSDMESRKQFGSWPMYFFGQPKFAILTYALALFGFYKAFRDFLVGRQFVLILIAFGAVQVAAYSWLRAPVGYFWYLAPGNLAVDMAVAFGVFRICLWVLVEASDKAGFSLNESVSNVVVAALVFTGMLFLSAAPYKMLKPYRLGSEYTKVGEWISENTPRDSVVAATEIGYIGYFSGRNIRDIHGLIHPEARQYLRREEWEWWYKSDPPNVIVMHKPAWPGEPGYEVGWQSGTLRDFRSGYKMVKSFGLVEIYQRKPSGR